MIFDEIAARKLGLFPDIVSFTCHLVLGERERGPWERD